ncbi:f1 atpase assembly protein 11 [Moniliophthora roreri MCA 2997]|uniref:F1 atpase assembly protein 11 n=1 Tax=Moniliophthora roreri (strain MCA 2997) TaxID=1381753 RepID=V2YV27_MONRO|nr:f1 atpase assembly protein 11 [Moniliophthora roreri MCA 2997]
MFRTALTTISRPAGARALHSTPVAAKTVTEKVSEVADTVNKKVGKGLASAIDKGEHAANATKETLSSTTGQAKQKGSEASTVASQKANQAAAGAREAKEDFKKEVRK